jgi:hypothetical protein
MKIHLGFEIGSGKAVSIPLAHMAVTGQTQQSGKTTTLEALIDRSGVRAVVFVTKPGEKSFTEGRRILPYFRERADWEYVKDLLEARTGERMGNKVGYLMRVCERAKSLHDVRGNISIELKKKKTRSARPDTHEVLAGYIDLILDEFSRVTYTDRLDLATGVNIMDLSGIADDTQDMIIRSTVEEIHKRAHNTVIVVPEAWKVIPEGSRSLVFEALHRLIREGATNGNFVWIDAQDLAIVNKRILKSVTVWILGKQQEANEVVRTIRHLIAPVNIEPDKIKSLGKGEFLACYDSSTHLVYVQPRWLGDLDAVAIAKREETVETAAQVFREKKRKGEIRGVTKAVPIVDEVIKADHVSLVVGAPHALRQLQIMDQEVPEDDRGRKTQIDSRIEKHDSDHQSGHPETVSGAHELSPGADSGETDGDETMWKERFDKDQAEIRQLKIDLAKATHEPVSVWSPNGQRVADEKITATFPSIDSLYAQIRERAIAEKDPAILRLLVSQPELRVKIEPKVLEVDESSARGQVAKLIHEGFFTEPRNGNGVCTELLDRRRFKGARVSIYDALNDIAGMGFLVRDSQKQYKATGVKVTVTR